MLRNELPGFGGGDGSGDELAILLKLAEGLEGFMEAALRARGSAGGERDQILVYRAGEIIGLPESGFEGTETAQPSEVLSELINEDFLGGVGGLVLGAELEPQLIEFGGRFVGEDKGFGIEAVLERVLGAALLAFRGARTGGWVGGVRFGEASGFAGFLGETALGGAADGTWAHGCCGLLRLENGGRGEWGGRLEQG